MWTPQFMGLALGALLVVIAILGGGIEVKEIKIPQLSTGARLGAAAFGVVLMAASYLLISPSAPSQARPTGTAPATASAPAPRPITFTDALGPGQLQESLEVFIDGQRVGAFSIDLRQPRGSFQIPGETRSASYQISGAENRDGHPGERRVDGSGTIDLTPGAIFGVSGRPQPDVAVRKVELVPL
jgi:hypothetical protein